MNENQRTGTLFIIPHTHWEGAVFQTREAYLRMGLPNILRALALLRAYPHYRFTLDQACYVKPFLERYPQEEADFRRFIAEGRLAIVGGTDVMLDVNMPGGESFVRQVLYGKGYFREKLGVDVTVGWQLDTFGHHAQMPQLLRLAGFRSFWFFRGVPDWDTPAEFLWEGLDGTRIPAVWLPEGYAVAHGSPASLPEFSAHMQSCYERLGRWSPGPDRVGPDGPDVCPPEEHLPALVEQHNRQPDQALRLQLATPQEYEAAVHLGESGPVLTGELNPVFQGIYSSRIELKQITHRLENLLTTAEALGVLLRCVGVETSDDTLWAAWEPMLFNQAHDLMSGVMTDAVYEDTLGGYDFSRRIAEHEVETRLRRYCEAVDTQSCSRTSPVHCHHGQETAPTGPETASQGEGLALVVFNALGFARTGVVTTTIGFARQDVRAIRLTGADGEPLACQILREERYGNGALLEADIAFVARDVPALGHIVYWVLPTEPDDPDAAVPGTPSRAGVLENELLRVQIDPGTGAILSILDKVSGQEVLSAPGNVIVREEDHGDLWEPYRPLDGGSRIAMKDEHPVPPRGQAVYSDEQTGEPGQGVIGPVVSEFSVEHDFGDKGRFATMVRVYSGMPRIEVQTRLVNNDEFVRYRALFPTTIKKGRVVHEIPFGAIERPCGIEFPAQNWADYGDGTHGLALLNRGLPGNAVSDGTLLLSLLRSTRIVAYGFGGGYGPGMSSDSGLELGKEFTFDYALLPHAGDWRQTGLCRQGLEFNSPLQAVTAAMHAGVLPARWGFVQVLPDNVMVSALKPSREGSAVLRVYEAAGQATPGVEVRLPGAVQQVQEVDLMEDPMAELQCEEGIVRFDLRPFEIKTLRFKLPHLAG
ncbi:MAG: hypothetical protein HPY69_07720 [Armatimonadetes bacterium]|nr:hypothetical protein [Armatimonadota bacterium]